MSAPTPFAFWMKYGIQLKLTTHMPYSNVNTLIFRGQMLLHRETTVVIVVIVYNLAPAVTGRLGFASPGCVCCAIY